MINSHPLVTIAIPTYNRADAYLKQAIQSALSQTYPNIEIIVSDNCSTDDTEALVKSFSDPHLRYIKHKNNIGANNNFNYCLQKAIGKYFLLLHDDDLIDDEFISTCIKALDRNDSAGIIRTGARNINSAGTVILERENLAGDLSLTDFFLGWFLDKTPMYLCSTLFSTKRLRAIGGFKSKHNLYEDVIAMVIIAAKFDRVDVREIKASFRNHPLQITNSAAIGGWCEDSLFLLDTMYRLAPDNKKFLRRAGFNYLLKRNFMMASRIQSSLQKYMAYLVIFRTFNYPVKFFAERFKIKIKEVKKSATRL
jgi:glycosyltransferase involved in cell wall biosynthesis